MQHTVISLMQTVPASCNRVGVTLPATGIQHRIAVRGDDGAARAFPDDVGREPGRSHAGRSSARTADRRGRRARRDLRASGRAGDLPRATRAARGDALGSSCALVRECDARVLEAVPHAMMLAVMGRPDAVSDCLERLKAFDILELTRSGRIAMTLNGVPEPRTAEVAPRARHRDWRAASLYLAGRRRRRHRGGVATSAT